MQNQTPAPPPKLFGPCLGGGGRPVGAVPGTPTYIPQDDPLVALIILNTHICGVLGELPTGGPVPAAKLWGGGRWGGGGEVMGEFFPLFCMYI